MSRFLYKNRSSKSRKTSKESDDTISIHDEWLLEEEEKNKNNDNKNNKKNKKKKVKSSKYWPFSKVKGRGVSGSKTLLSILKDHTLDLSELCEKFQNKEQNTYYEKLRKQILKLIEEDDLEGVVDLVREENGKRKKGKKNDNEIDGAEEEYLTLEDQHLSNPKNHMNLLHTSLEESHHKISTHLIKTGTWDYLTKGYTNIRCQIPPSAKNNAHILAEQGNVEMFEMFVKRLKDLEHPLTTTQQAVLSPVFDNTPLDRVSRFLQAEVVLKDVNGKRRVGLCHIAAMNGHTKMIGRLKEMGLPLDACDSWGETPLMWAVQKGRTEVFEELLQLGADVNKKNHYGCTALHLALVFKQQEMAKILIEYPETDLNIERIKNPRWVVEMISRADDKYLMEKLVRSSIRDKVNKKNFKNALFIAAKLNHVDILDTILDQIPGLTNAVDDLGNTPVMVAAKKPNMPCVKLLVDKYQADINLKNHYLETIYDLAIRQHSNQLLEYLMEQTKSNEMLKPIYLHTAAANGDNEKIEFILKAGKLAPLQLDTNHNTIFHTSAAHDAYQVLDYFLAKDDDLTEIQNKEGETPLHIAVKKGNVGSVKVLLERNAGTNIGDNINQNALHCSISTPHCSYEVVSMVAEKMKERCPDDLNDQDFDGNTALHLAAKYSRSELMELLSDLDPNVENIHGETALHMAVKMGEKKEIEALLDQFYAEDKDHSVNVDKKDSMGCTSLYRSAERGDCGKFECLMSFGADLTARNIEEKSILHRIVEQSALKNTESEKYLEIYKSIVEWSVKWFCRKQGSRLPPENTWEYYEVRLEAVRELTSNIYYQNCNVLQYASKMGASSLLKCILNTLNVYKFNRDCPPRMKQKVRKNFSSNASFTPILSEFLTNIQKDPRMELYDVTYLIPLTKPQEEVPVEIDYRGQSRLRSKDHNTSCLEEIVYTNDEGFINDVLDTPSFLPIVSRYWKLCRRVYEVLMWLHVIYMIIFTYFTLPSREFLKHRFDFLSRTYDGDVVKMRYDYVKNLGWLLIWPVFILLSEVFMMTYRVLKMKESRLNWKSLMFGKHKVGEITSGMMKFPVGLMLVIFNNLTTISALTFSVSSLLWFTMAIVANNPHDYLECLSIVMIFGWLHTIAYVKGFKDWNSIVSILKEVIIKDITCFIYIYIFVMISFGYAMHVLMQADYSLDYDERQSTTSIYLTFMRTISPGNLMDLSEDKGYEKSGGRVYFIRAVCACYAIFATVVLMNLLIAMMNSTYSSIRSNKSTAWRIESLRFILWLERVFPCGGWKSFLSLSPIYDREHNRWFLLEDSVENIPENDGDKKERYGIEALENVEKNSKRQTEAIMKIEKRIEKLEEELVVCRDEMVGQFNDEKTDRTMLLEMKMEMKKILDLCLQTSALHETKHKQK